MSNSIAVLSSTAMKTSLDEIGPIFERQSGAKLHVSYAPSVRLSKQIAQGLRGDIAIVTAPQIDALTTGGHIVAGSRTDIAISQIGLAVQAAAPRPDISTVDGFRETLLAARSIGMSNPIGGGQSGANLQSAFERLGIAEVLKEKLFYGPGGPEGLIGLFLKRGEIEIGLQQMPELMAVPGIDIVGPLPDGVQAETTFSMGLMIGSDHAAAAKQLAALFRSDATRNMLRLKGFAPA